MRQGRQGLALVRAAISRELGVCDLMPLSHLFDLRMYLASTSPKVQHEVGISPSP